MITLIAGCARGIEHVDDLSRYLGVDIGASAAKAVIIAGHRRLRGKAVVPSGMDFRKAGEAAVRLALDEAGPGHAHGADGNWGKGGIVPHGRHDQGLQAGKSDS